MTTDNTTNDTTNDSTSVPAAAPHDDEALAAVASRGAVAAKLIQADDDRERQRIALWEEIQQHMKNTVQTNGFDRSNLNLTRSKT